MNYQNKYLKYKEKYLKLKNQMGGVITIATAANNQCIDGAICSICQVAFDYLEQTYKLTCGCCIHEHCMIPNIRHFGVGNDICLPHNVSFRDDIIEYLTRNPTLVTPVELDDYISRSAPREANRICEISSDPFIIATTKNCPTCCLQTTHYHGHECHHISPNNGCPNCHVHYCYKCLSTGPDNLRDRGNSSICLCGFWSSYCSPITDLAQITMSPVPHDNRCGCVFCPDCRFEIQCAACDGNCMVCRGVVPPGVRSLEEVNSLTIKLNSYTFNSKGFNSDGFNRNGVHLNDTSYDNNGFDISGFNIDGFNRDGFYISGIHLNGTPYDNDGFNRDGFDISGLDINGFNRDGFDRIGFDINGFDRFSATFNISDGSLASNIRLYFGSIIAMPELIVQIGLLAITFCTQILIVACCDLTSQNSLPTFLAN